MLETWDWYNERFTDSKVCQFLNDHVYETRQQDSYGQSQFIRYWRLDDLAKALKFHKRRVEKSLERLRVQNKVMHSSDGWLAKRRKPH
jgi:hypothetical protein